MNFLSPSSVPRRRLLGEMLISAGLVSQDDMEQALQLQSQLGDKIGTVLVRLGALAENDLLQALSRQSGVPVLGREEAPAPEDVDAAIGLTGCSLHWLVEKSAIIWFAPGREQETLHCASRDPLDPALQEAAEQWSDKPAVFLLASSEMLESVLQPLVQRAQLKVNGDAFGADANRLREMAEEAPVIDFVNAVFSEAIARRASDIHIEPFEDQFVVRLRVDGALQQWRSASRAQFDAVSSRIKLLSGMNIAERRLPQDGRQSIRLNGREVDLRVSSLPSTWGESLVLRLLGKVAALPELRDLGVADDQRALLEDLILRPNGILLVTGPTGSGKTTTIYRLLTQLNNGVRKILTVEDPVEFNLPGVVQMNVRSDIGLTFASGLRSILRQDPDVILVGEIRDAETAQIAVQAALTGHLVVSTLHTNSAMAAFPRLLDLGIESFLLSEVLRGVVAQRLVRKLCLSCARPITAEVAAPLEALAQAQGVAVGSANWREQSSCNACGGSGYRGRLGIYEVVAVDAHIQAAIRKEESESFLTQLAFGARGRSMYADGLLKARSGATTWSEVVRVVQG